MVTVADASWNASRSPVATSVRPLRRVSAATAAAGSRQPRSRVPKKRFSELAGEAACNQEYTGGLQQRLDDEAEPVIAQGEAFVLEHPGIAAFDRPAVLSQP